MRKRATRSSINPGSSRRFCRKAGSSLVAGHSTARRCELKEVFSELADRFHEVRLALNHLSDELLNLDDDSSSAALLR